MFISLNCDFVAEVRVKYLIRGKVQVLLNWCTKYQHLEIIYSRLFLSALKLLTCHLFNVSYDCATFGPSKSVCVHRKLFLNIAFHCENGMTNVREKKMSTTSRAS